MNLFDIDDRIWSHSHGLADGDIYYHKIVMVKASKEFERRERDVEMLPGDRTYFDRLDALAKECVQKASAEIEAERTLALQEEEF